MVNKKNDLLEYRKPSYPINSLILERWSPRAMTGEPISDEEIMSLFEAARWAPSSYNNQPWRFIYAKHHTPSWPVFFDLLVDFNKQWCKNAAVLVIVVTKKTYDYNGKPSRTASFDTGAAWENLALEATSKGLVAHGMEGFDERKAAKMLDLPSDHEVQMMIAIGKRGKKELLTKDLQDKEVPSDRKPLSAIVMEGKFRL